MTLELDAPLLDNPGITFRLYGAIAEVSRMRDPRILLEGPANTGKTSGLLRLFESYAWECPGIRVLLCRQTMKSMRESVMVTLEDKVWAPMMEALGTPGARHPAMHGTASRATRDRYCFPNGTTYVLGGLDDPGWTFSMEYDLIGVFEAWQVSKDSIQKLYRANRNHVLCRYRPENQELAQAVNYDWTSERWMREHGDPPFGCWQQLFLDTNPAGEFNPCNQMAAPIGGEEVNRLKGGALPSRRVFRSPDHELVRVLSRHEDNPACTADDISKLDALDGPRKQNLRFGLWVSSEGQVWPTFDPLVHMLTGTIERHGERDTFNVVDEREMVLVFHGDRGPHLPARVEIKWAFASMDLGFRNAGCLQVWLVDYDDRLYRAVEIHRREQIDDWWTERALELRTEFNLYAIVIDCEDPERAVKMNDRMEKTDRVARGGVPIVFGVDKSVRKGNRTKFIPTSLDLVREALNPTQKGGPTMYWLRDSLREGRDPISVENRWPTCSEEEIGSFVFPLREDGKPDSEEPAKECKQDGCAATRYAAVYFWLMDPKGPKVVPVMPPGTAGWRMGHAAILAKSQRNLR